MVLTVPSGDCAESAIIHRLFSASMEIHSALQLVHDDPTTELLRYAIDNLDQAIKQVRDQAYDLRFQSGPKNESVPSPVSSTVLAPGPRAHLLVARPRTFPA